MTIHFIAIGGSVMHNLALALQRQGHTVQGSDDIIYGAAAHQLAANNLLPKEFGWFPEKITPDVDAVILGMHAKKDNPELLKAQALDLPVYSLPEFLAKHSAQKQRIVIAGSHGKTSITAMVMHVLQKNNYAFDYAVGAKLDKFDGSVSLSDKKPMIILEGDEYPSSPLDLSPKAINLNPHMLVLSGIAWDHANIYPDKDAYHQVFTDIAACLPKAGVLLANKSDKQVKKLAEQLEKENQDINVIFYTPPKAKLKDGIYYIKSSNKEYPIQVFGEHNLENIGAALAVVKRLGLKENEFFDSISDFKGADKRLTILRDETEHSLIQDFAHSPSKVRASISAVKDRFPKRKLTACLELHTFSSLSLNFIQEYKNAAKPADELLIFIQTENFKRKNRNPFGEDELRNAFAHKNLKYFTKVEDLEMHLKKQDWTKRDLLMMSSGDWAGLNLNEL